MNKWVEFWKTWFPWYLGLAWHLALGYRVGCMMPFGSGWFEVTPEQFYLEIFHHAGALGGLAWVFWRCYGYAYDGWKRITREFKDQ